MDRGFLDLTRLYRLTQAAAFFVVRTKRGLSHRRMLSCPVDRTSGIICDQDVRPAFDRSARKFPSGCARFAIATQRAASRFSS
jgi:hypothetical protein